MVRIALGQFPYRRCPISIYGLLHPLDEWGKGLWSSGQCTRFVAWRSN